MLTVFRSNRAEWLAKVLAEQLRLDPPDLFEEVDIIVNTWPTSRWLGEEIAKTNGISSLVRFPFPGTYLRKLVQTFLKLEVTDNDPWRSSQLVWHILEIMPELLNQDEAKTLKEWLNCQESNRTSLNKDRWQLADKIAKTFDEYDLYRCEMVREWLEETQIDKTKNSHKVPKRYLWQPKLYHLLRARIKSDPFSLQVKKVIERLKRGDIGKHELPSHLYFFGINSLAPIQIDLIQALSSVIEIKFFLITPCKDLWQRFANRRIELGDNWDQPTNNSWLLKASRLEAILGRTGSEFEQLLEGTGDCQLGEVAEEDFFAMPSKISQNSNNTPTLLEQFQQSLVNREDEVKITKDSSDNSLTFIECPGYKRELQVVKDQIIQWLAQDETLQPRDILIMTPQIERFSPFIPSIFNDTSATSLKLPWRITDRTQQDKPGLTKWLIELMNIACSELTSLNLDLLIATPLIQKQYKLTTDEIDKITSCLQSSGFRRGVAGDEYDDIGTHTLRWCLERWLVGITIPANTSPSTDGIAPYSLGITIDDLTKWWQLLSRIANNLIDLKSSRLCSEWIALIKNIVNDHFDIEYEFSWEYKNLASALDEWLMVAGECSLKIDTPVVIKILEDILSKESGRFGHRSGKITISALEPMRTIPHKAIILMGLDETIFPRKQQRPDFNLLLNNYHLGDPDISNKDRYALLEALTSTRKYLLITWNSKNEQTGEVLQPSIPIQQWIDCIKHQLGEHNMQGIVRNAPNSPLNEKNFISEDSYPALSCNQRHLEASLYLREEQQAQMQGIALPLSWTHDHHNQTESISNEQIIHWLTAPQLFWLSNKQMNPSDWGIQLEDIESLSLNELKRYRLLSDKFKEWKNNSLTRRGPLQDLEEVKWEKEYKGQGLLPPKSAGHIEAEILSKRWASLTKTISELGNINVELLNVGNEIHEVLISDSYLINIEIGKAKSSSILRAWLLHIQQSAFYTKPKETVLISRKESNLKKNEFHISYMWRQIPKDESIKILTELKFLVSKGLEHCWPAPPNSSLFMALATSQSPSKGNEVFKQCWEGGYKKEGERDKEEMRICFGEECEAEIFLKNEFFKECMSILYDPLIKFLK